MSVALLPVLAAAAMSAAANPAVTLDKMVYGPAPAGLRVGQTLMFRNADMFEHTATSKGDFDLDLKPGQSGAAVLRRAGVYDVSCRFHPTMKLRLEVAPARATAKGKAR